MLPEAQLDFIDRDLGIRSAGCERCGRGGGRELGEYAGMLGVAFGRSMLAEGHPPATDPTAGCSGGCVETILRRQILRAGHEGRSGGVNGYLPVNQALPTTSRTTRE